MRQALLLAAGVLALGTPATGREAGLTLWRVDPLVKVLRTDVPPGSPAKSVAIEAARGEVENGQIAFRSTVDAARLTASATPLQASAQQTLAAPRVRFVGYVPIKKNTAPHLAETGPQVVVAKAPVDLPDPLLEDSFIPAKAGESGAIWLTVPVPADAPPGTYRGEVSSPRTVRKALCPLKLRCIPRPCRGR